MYHLPSKARFSEESLNEEHSLITYHNEKQILYQFYGINLNNNRKESENVKPYEEMKQCELWDAMQDAGLLRDGKKMRKIHKCLKKYNDGVPFIYRYPYLPIVLSIAALIVQIVTVIVRLCL